MVSTLTDTKRTAIAEKLAEMYTIQNVLINNEKQFLKECRETKVRDRLEDMIEDDEKNLTVIETVITQYGVPAKTSQPTQQRLEQVQALVKDPQLSLYERLLQHELLKHGQVMSGLVVHKAAQIVGKDVQEALAPMNLINFENRAHQEQLKGLLEYLGTYELTGEEPDQGFWVRIQDTVAAMTGVVGSAVKQGTDGAETDILTLIFMDHQKARTLLREIEKTDDSQRVQEYFGQLYKDLLVHSKAEEEVVYPAVRAFYGDNNTQELYNEQEQLAGVLNEAKALSPTSDAFRSKIKEIKTMVGDHTRQEESTMFAAMRKNLSEAQREQMATQFINAKKHLQTTF